MIFKHLKVDMGILMNDLWFWQSSAAGTPKDIYMSTSRVPHHHAPFNFNRSQTITIIAAAITATHHHLAVDAAAGALSRPLLAPPSTVIVCHRRSRRRWSSVVFDILLRRRCRRRRHWRRWQSHPTPTPMLWWSCRHATPSSLSSTMPICIGVTASGPPLVVGGPPTHRVIYMKYCRLVICWGGTVWHTARIGILRDNALD